MARSVPWRRTISDVACWRQAEAGNATIYILRETGPTGFLLKEEGEPKNVKVFLGDPNSCTCAQFRKDKDLCKHICWLLLKKFRVPKENPLSWQLGLVEREINEILRGVVQQQQQRQPEKKKHHTVLQIADGREVKGQREISADDVCPICQDELLGKHLPVTYCKFGCGNSIHIKCMKVWAEHQQGKGQTNVKCPMCREDFGPLNLLKQEMRNASGGEARATVRMDRHLGSNCQSCHVSPIEGKCYRCKVCADFMLCQTCFNTPVHTHHDFEYRHKRNQKWRIVNRVSAGLLPEAVVNNLMNRDLTSDDYDCLLQLDSNQQFEGSSLTEEEVNSIPQQKVREGGQLLAPGMQCRICLRAYEIGQYVRRLPCRHKFHKECVDNWLLHTRPTCPIDGYLVQDLTPPNTRERRPSIDSTAESVSSITGQAINLEIPGIGIAAIPSTRQDASNRLFRRPARQHHIQHRAPSSLELAGTGFMSTSEPSLTPETTQQSLLPGNSLLNRANRNQQLISNQLSSNESRSTSFGRDIEFNDFLQTGSNSSPVTRRPPAGHVTNGDLGNARRGRNLNKKEIKHPFLKRRSASRDRSASRERLLNQAIQQAQNLSVQNLYLGNNPRTNPIEQGQMFQTTHGRSVGQINSLSSTVTHGRSVGQINSLSSTVKKTSVNPVRDLYIQLEGMGLENITLRDIIDDPGN